MNRDLLLEKSSLVTSETYIKVREHQLKHILALSNTNTEPIIIKGMLKTIADTDKWHDEFLKEKEKLSKNKE